MRILIYIFVTISFISGCSNTAKYHIESVDAQKISQLDKITLQLMPLEDGPLTVDIYPEPWRYISVSSNMAAAQYSAPPPTPGTSPGQAAAAGAAVALIGTLIASEMVKSQAQKEAQTPAQPLIDALSILEIELETQKKISHSILISDFALNDRIIVGESPETHSAQLVLSPSIKLSNALNVLKFNINAELRDRDNILIFRNSIEYWSEGTAHTSKAENLVYWQSEDLKAFFSELDAAIKYTVGYLTQSLNATLPEQEENQKTHKVVSDNGWVMVRGNLLLDDDGGCVVVKDLRGNIKIIRGELL